MKPAIITIIIIVSIIIFQTKSTPSTEGVPLGSKERHPEARDGEKQVTELSLMIDEGSAGRRNLILDTITILLLLRQCNRSNWSNSQN